MQLNELFILSEAVLNAVVSQIDDEQWDMEMPDTFITRLNETITLRQVINYHAYDDAWVPDILAGRTMDEVGAEKFDGDLLVNSPTKSYADYVDKAVEAARTIAPEDLERTAHLSYGDYPVGEYLKHITLFRTFRAHDLAEVIGVSTHLPIDLVQGVWDFLVPVAEEWRSYGIMGPRVEVPEHAELQDRLLGLGGREPDNDY